MKTRRGTMVASDLQSALSNFKEGDVVTSVITGSIDFIGRVVDVDRKICKVSVDWGDGSVTQHDPDEVQHSPHYLAERVEVEGRAASRRASLSKEATDLRPFAQTGELISLRDRSALTEDEAKEDPQFVGDPKIHGIDKPVGGGFSIMQRLQKKLAPEALQQSKEGPKIAPQQAGETEEDLEEASGDQNAPGGDLNAPQIASMRSRRAMYWTDKDRVYRLTKNEQSQGNALCPKCRKEMEKQRFTRNDKLYNCPGCGFKIPSSKTVTERKVEVELEPDGTIEVEIEPVEKEASTRRGRNAAIEVPDNLSRMTLSEIASLISADWARVNFAAKPYLEAMFSLSSVKDMYYMDTGSSIVAYFLSNASGWRGDVAKAVKKELKKRLK